MDLATKLFEGINSQDKLSIPTLEANIAGIIDTVPKELQAEFLALAETLREANDAIKKAADAANSDAAVVEVKEGTTFQGTKSPAVQLGTWITRDRNHQITAIQTGENMLGGIFTGFMGDKLTALSTALFAYGQIVEIRPGFAISQGCLIKVGSQSLHLFQSSEEPETSS